MAFRQRLEVVRNENGPWFALAQAMMEEAGTSPSPEKTAAIISTAREVTQLSVQILKRYLALIFRIAAIADFVMGPVAKPALCDPGATNYCPIARFRRPTAL